MELEWWMLLLLGVSVVKSTDGRGPSPSDDIDDVIDLREQLSRSGEQTRKYKEQLREAEEQLKQTKDLLRQTEEQLRHPRDQNSIQDEDIGQLKQVWTHLQNICDVVSKPCTCEDKSGDPAMTSEPPTQSSPTTTPAPSTFPPPPSSIALVRAASSGNSTGEVTLTMTYTAPPEHTTDWLLHFKDYKRRIYTVQRTAGTRTSTHANTYSSTVTVPYYGLRLPIIRIYAGHDTLSAYYSGRDVAKIGHKTMTPIESSVSDISFNYVSSADRDLNVTLVVKEGVRIFRAIYTGLNMSVETNEVFIKNDFNDEAMMKTRYYPYSDGTSRVVITLKQPYAALGGFLTIILEGIKQPQSAGFKNIVSVVSAGYMVKILPPNRDTIIPENTVGLSKMENIMYADSLQQSLDCTAVGNPRPNVQIFMEKTDGSLAEILTESIVFPERGMTVATHLLDATERHVVGKYVCRAESGTAFAETRAEVKLRQE